MRALSYKVLGKDGTIFETHDYQYAIAEGRIIEHILTEVREEETEEQRQKRLERIRLMNLKRKYQ
jgi:hypothetical protein